MSHCILLLAMCKQTGNLHDLSAVSIVLHADRLDHDGNRRLLTRIWLARRAAAYWLPRN